MREFSHEKLFQICIELLENQRLGSLSPLLTGIKQTTNSMVQRKTKNEIRFEFPIKTIFRGGFSPIFSMLKGAKQT